MDNNQVTPAQHSNSLIKYLLWVFWNTLGFTLALPIVILILIALGSILRLVLSWSQSAVVEGFPPLFSNTLQVIAIGLIIGLCQGFALGFRKISLTYWLLANALSWAIFLAFALNSPTEQNYSISWVGVLLRGIGMGLLIGIPQGFLMQRTNQRSWWWVFANILGGIGGFAVVVPVSGAILNIMGETPNIIIFSVIPLFGFVSSIISGIFLIRPIRWFDSEKAA
jgi:hypothetical protein